MGLKYSFITILLILPLLLIFWKDFRRLFYKPYPNAIKKLSEEEFYSQFEVVMPSEEDKKRLCWKELIDKAWDTRNFEIDLYWKRANYFWLFQVPAFGAYFAMSWRPTYVKSDSLFVIMCLGIIFSTAWLLINKGSKSWQRHWEQYIDLLERKYYGPFYQTVGGDRTFSVTKINEIVSSSFIFVWVFFAILFLCNGHYFDKICFRIEDLNATIAFSILFTILALISMLFGYGRGYFKEREIKMFLRNHIYGS